MPSELEVLLAIAISRMTFEEQEDARRFLRDMVTRGIPLVTATVIVNDNGRPVALRLEAVAST